MRNHPIAPMLLAAMFAAAALSACDKKPADVPTPSTGSTSTAPMANTPASDPSMPPSSAASEPMNSASKP